MCSISDWLFNRTLIERFRDRLLIAIQLSPLTADYRKYGMNRDAPGKERQPKKRSIVRRLVFLATIVVAATIFFAFAGRLHWTLELATHFRWQYLSFSVLVLLAALLFRCWKCAVVCVVALVISSFMVLPAFIATADQGMTTRSVRILFANVYVRNRNSDALLELVRLHEPDVVIVAETDQEWIETLKTLETNYPHARYEANYGAFGISTLTRVTPDCFAIEWIGTEVSVPITKLELSIDQMPLTIYGVHVESPGNHESLRIRSDHMEHLAEMIGKDPTRCAVIGDLNISPWSPYFGDFLQSTGLRDSRRGFGIQNSWPTWQSVAKIPIDHCLVSKDIVVKRREVLNSISSDHHPILVEIAIKKSND